MESMDILLKIKIGVFCFNFSKRRVFYKEKKNCFTFDE